MTGNGKATGIAPPSSLLRRMQRAGASSQALKMSRGSRAALLCGTKRKLAVRLPPVLYTAWTGTHRSGFGCGDLIKDAFPGEVEPV